MKFFCDDLEIEVPKGVYYPREDSLLLSKNIPEGKGKCIEIGCGSGFVSIIAYKKGWNVFSVDINEKAIEATKKNCNELKVIQSDIFSNIDDRYDLVLCNSPYLEKDEDSKYMKGESEHIFGGSEFLKRFLDECRNKLNENGKILVVISSLTKDFEKIYKTFGYKGKEIKTEWFFFEGITLYELTIEAE